MFCKSSWNNSKSFEIILSCLAIGNQSLDAIKILNSIQDKYQPSITVAKNIVQGLLKSGNQELAHAFVEKFDSGVLKSHYDAVCARLYGSDRTVAQWVAFLQVTPDLELATKLIDSFSKNGDYDSVLRIYQAVPSSSRLQACLASAAIVCKQPWKELVSNIEEMELSSYSRLLSSLLFTNNIHDALEIYNQMIKVYSPSAHIICSFLGYYSRMKQPQNVIESYNKFINDGGVPNASVFEILFSVCKNEQNMDPYWKEFDHWLQSHSQKESFASIRLKKNIILSPTLVKFRIRYLVKQKLWSDLEKFIQILNPNENSFYVAQAYLYQILGKAENVDIILASMEQNGFQPTQETFGIQLRAWTRKNNPPKIESIIRKMVSLQIPLQRYHHRDIILGFVSAKKFKKAIRWLHVMKASGFGIAKLKVKVEHEMCIIGNRDFDHLFTSIALDQGLNRWLHQIYPI
jgi:tetratricopeptide (TPR) repeat protein